MKKVFKWLVIIVLVIVVLIFSGIGYVKFFLPNVGDAPDLTVEVTQERVARGEYLANSVCVCMDCHSTRDWNKFSGPLKEGTYGAGGEKFGRELGFPGVYYSKNITPHGVGDWTDGELFRVITTGVDKDGEPLFPVMPYTYYGKMDKEDIYSIIAYMRTLKPIESVSPEREVDPPMNIIMNMIPQKADPQEMPDQSDKLAYGKYLTNASGCVECHTPAEKGQIKPELAFSGGRVFELPGGTLRSPNITPHNTGISYLNEETFIALFKQYQDSGYAPRSLDFMSDYNTIMPWMMYSSMTEEDLSAIYAYLQTVKPIENQVTKFTAKTAKK